MKKSVALISVLVALAANADDFVVSSGPHGKVKFKVEGPIDDVHGETRAVSGKLEVDPQKWTQTKGWVAVELAALRTGIEQRDRDMREEFLETGKHPFALLSVEKIERPSVPVLNSGSSVDGEAVATFELHGVRRPVRFPCKLKLDDNELTVSGAFEVAFSDYSIARPQRLIFKLGDVAEVSFFVVFNRQPKDAPVVVAKTESGQVVPEKPTVVQLAPMALKPKPRPPRKPKPELQIVWQFKGDDVKAKGERLFHSTDLGGAGNKLTCYHCHAKADERAGLLQKDGFVRSGSTMVNAAQRGKFWGGFAGDIGKGANICQKMFMKGEGLSAQQQKELAAFLAAMSPDPQPPLDVTVAYATYEAKLPNPTGGDPARGKSLADQYCMTCHLDGRVGPVWAFGLYEPEWIVQRVRHLEGHTNKQMPAFAITRLPDTDLRDIVTYLANPKTEPIFDRKKKSAAR